VTGGEVEGGRTAAPGETPGKRGYGGRTEESGTSRHCSDPAVVPHRVLIDAGQKSTCLVFKIDVK